MNVVFVLENIRSAYNVGNIIRTADALGFDVVLSGFTPNPSEEDKVKKTSLGAEESVNVRAIWDTFEAIQMLKNEGYYIVAAENAGNSIGLNKVNFNGNKKLAVVMGNENDGVLKETLEICDKIVHIPMVGIKESFNVGQAAAIFMREIYQRQQRIDNREQNI